MEPRQAIQFSEYWMPVRDIGGISRANLAGVLSIGRRGNSLTVGFNANQTFAGATVSILAGNKRTFGETVDLRPDHAWIHDFPLTGDTAKYTVEIRDARGTVLIHQTEGEYDWDPDVEIHVGPQSPYRIPDEAKRTCDDWIQLGKEYELNGRIVRALDIYKEALSRFPASLDASKAAGGSERARALVKSGINNFPLSLFLREELSDLYLTLLSNDSTLVLNFATQYIRLALYKKALLGLSRDYPPANTDQSGPGELSP